MTDDARPGHDTAVAWATVIACMALVVSRKPDAFLAAQFWAEDGVVWYRQAYDMGWESLLHPQNGYFQSVSKIAGNLGQFVSLAQAPLVFAMTALLFKVLPVALLFSARGTALVPTLAGRLLMAFLYVAHPYSWEVFINVTNIHWHLAVAALLVVCFTTWDNGFQKVSDVSIVLLCGLSGTFALFLAPISAWLWYRTRSRRSFVLAAILILTAVVQVASIVWTGSSTRSSAPMDASWADLFRIVGGQVTAAALLGEGWRHVFESAVWQRTWVAPLALSATLAVFMGRAFLAGSLPVKSLIALSAMVFAAALMSPQISSTQGQWPLFTRPGTGGRYAFIPILGFYASLAWVAAWDRSPVFRRGAQALLAVVLVVGVPMSWRVRPYDDVGFPAAAEAFERARPGQLVRVPVNPPGWEMPLRKK